MESPKNKSKLTAWLEVLQQESWQLELIISGFAIFLVGSLKIPLFDFVSSASVISKGFENDVMTMVPTVILLASWFFLLINLILHVLLRGLWISTIGLRYVSGDIDFDLLKYSPKFDRFLRKRIVSFDLYIERLERLCSIVFSFTFLIIFGLISCGLFFTYFTFIYYLISIIFGRPTDSLIAEIIFSTFSIVSIITILLYFLDFITLGFFKRLKWFGPIYYPIYRFYGFITLANIYRPIYYNLIDNKFGRWVGRLIVPYIIIAIYFVGIDIISYKFYPELDTGSVFIKDGYYKDQLKEHRKNITNPFIQSKYISNNYVEVFIPYLGVADDLLIKKTCPDFKPQKQLGIESNRIRFGFTNNDNRDLEMERDSSYTCLKSLYKIRIDDSLHTDISYNFYTLAKHKEPGLLSIIDVANLERGKHQLVIDKQHLNRRINKDSLYTVNFATIPFWIE